ncbi:CotS family spore coat protein [Clostridium butyricum 60E.3]|uniref:CotS family spore coat protein n=1 Tax=Clostridium TaxID=1485 RepID=UPI0002D1E9A3|nr:MULTISPECIES: CotS family spore coat protein [Clostridium]ENZ31249.1 CotS family spore coat protein [Clostridium butyricum 60E.3]MDB2139148.1 CotS family spore coat protein [Clostridium butyricum]MDI9207359.1 CotS family spore coat protein [Clostridium butyricum]MDU1117601.1 CotS family spore coat protein [Clostridium sp.]MDU1231665.1 CotS family spore coat protein [Clostridium sp.]
MNDSNNTIKIKKFIEENYDLTVEKLEKVKNSYKVITSHGTYSLKTIKYEFPHFYFILSAMKHLQENGFTDMPEFILNNREKEFGLMDKKYVYLTEWIPSRLSNFDNPIELSLVATELAKLHKSSCGFNVTEKMKARIGWFSWEEVFETRKNEILDFRNRIYQKAYKSDFDLLYLDNINSEIKRAEKSIEGLKKNNYIKVMEKEIFRRGFCHHDYAHHNILVDNRGKFKIIDFDYCILDSHLHDVSSLFIRSMKDGKWSDRKADVILYSYEKIFEIEKNELPIMREFIRFPQAFWQIGLQVYWEQQPWGEEFFLNKLKRYLEDCDEREEFIDSYFKGGD